MERDEKPSSNSEKFGGNAIQAPFKHVEQASSPVVERDAEELHEMAGITKAVRSAQSAGRFADNQRLTELGCVPVRRKMTHWEPAGSLWGAGA